MNQLNIQDCRNIIALLNRADFKGMDEAEAAVVLKQKIINIGNELENPAPEAPEVPQAVLDDVAALEENVDGSDVSSDAEQSPANAG